MTSSLSRKRSKPTELMNRTFVVGPMGAVSVIRLGLKPRTRSLEGCCSIQLSYRTGKKPRQLLSFVPGPGLEPGWVSPTVFETVASAYSAIRAYCRSFCVAKVRVFFVLTKFLIAQLNDLVYLVAQKGLKGVYYLADMPLMRSNGVGPSRQRSMATSLPTRLRKIIEAGITIATQLSKGTMALMRRMSIL